MLDPTPADSSSPDVDVVAEAIRDYLARHPNAADTVEGIQRWWLLGALGEVPPALVEQALERLEGDGAVRRIHLGWLPVRWGAPKPTRANGSH
ncbi:MAG: hypothetical protein MUF03_05185 [Rubrivivax sp.]|nr:hypothetical protein [Rubrivivax sp.]